MVTRNGLISRTREDKMPRLSGRDVARILVRANTHDTLYLVAENGEAAAVPMHILPEADKPSAGTPVHTISPLSEKHKIAVICAAPPKEERAKNRFVLTVTRQGMVKKSPLEDLPGPTAQTFVFVKVNQGDKLGWVFYTGGKDDILLATASGMAIRFTEADVRPMGLVAAGVMGIKLKGDDLVVAADLVPKKGEVFMVASDGTAKRTTISQFPRQGRYGQGVIAWRLPQGVQMVGMSTEKGTTRATLYLSRLAPKTIRLDDAVRQGRTARGRKLIDLKKGEKVTGLTVPWKIPRPTI
jgi:DNA gyrase subunit A